MIPRRTLDRESSEIYRPKINQAILSLAADPRPAGTKRLRGKLKEGWRIRISDYRVLYRIDDDAREVQIFDIGHRREVYR